VGLEMGTSKCRDDKHQAVTAPRGAHLASPGRWRQREAEEAERPLDGDRTAILKKSNATDRILNEI
jgi:hypothetical protein